MRRAPITIAAVLCLLGLMGGPALAGGGGGLCAGFAEGDEVILRDVCLEGTAHFLPAGADLHVTNEGQSEHDYVAIDGDFRTGRLAPGESETIPSPDPGVYRVYCSLHASAQGHGMAGVLIVEEPANGDAGVENAGAAAGDARTAGGEVAAGAVDAGSPLAGGAGPKIAIALAAAAVVTALVVAVRPTRRARQASAR